jgi:hypothetical protein
MKRLAIVAAWLALSTASAVCAYQLDDVRLEWWTGTGTNQVLLVVDFWPGNADSDSFAFADRFDAAEITGLQLLDALVAADHDFTYAQSGGFVTDIWYVKNGTTYHATYDWPNSYWSYWLSPDYGQTWDYSPVGPASRILHDGDTDGWLALPGDDYTSQPVTPLALGDLNCDDALDAFDIDPFVLALTDPAGYAQQYPDCDRQRADVNADGQIDAFDIDPFVNLLVGK